MSCKKCKIKSKKLQQYAAKNELLRFIYFIKADRTFFKKAIHFKKHNKKIFEKIFIQNQR